MLAFKNKYSITVKTSQQTYTIKSTLSPDLSQYDSDKVSFVWFRQPPPPYEIEELTFNFNKKLYRCNSLDYECSIVCKVINENGKQLDRFDYGPIQTFIFSRLSTNLELRVGVLLFNNVKKCLFSFSSTPTLINPLNNNKYQLTQQDIRSIYLKAELETNQNNTDSPQNSDQISFLNNQKKKTIVVENLFQRLILLKLFHDIPNGMYCYSMELVQITFYDESSCNMALFAINRFKYQKKDPSQISKSMFSPYSQDLSKSNLMKKSNESLTQFKVRADTQFQNPILNKNLSVDQNKRQGLFVPGLSNFKKSPKESINSANQSMSGNSGTANQSKKTLFQQANFKNKVQLHVQNRQSQTPGGSLQLKSKISLKNPKISVLSAQINSIKGPRQQKPSFPQTSATINLKSSQLLTKPNQLKSGLSLRRSQDQIKTPRMDAQDQTLGRPLEPIKKKSASEIQQLKEHNQQQNKYVNEFQNLLFEEENQQENKNQEMCLNDSFIKMQEQQQCQKQQNLSILINTNKNSQISQNLLKTISPSSPTKSQRNLISLKDKFLMILHQNFQIKQKNQELKRQIQQSKANTKKNEVVQYQEEIAKIKEQQQSLLKEIQKVKNATVHRNQRGSVNSKDFNQYQSLKQTNANRQQNDRPEFSQRKRTEFLKFGGGISSPPRQSRNANQLIFQYQSQINSPTLAGRRSQDNEYASHLSLEQQNGNLNGNIFNSGQLKFMRLQSDPDYQKFRNNQSYSYKTSDFNKNQEWRGGKQSYLKY